MIDQILSEGSLEGMILLFFGIFVLGHISGNTKQEWQTQKTLKTKLLSSLE